MMRTRKFYFGIILAFATCVVGLSRPALALNADQSALVQLANRYVTGAAGTSQSYVTGMAIYGTWAYVGWTDNLNSGGQIVASKSSGSWTIVKASGGQFSVAELQSFVGVDATSAGFLAANLRPLPPIGGTSGNASGSSSRTTITQDCPGSGGADVVKRSSTLTASTDLVSTPAVKPLPTPPAVSTYTTADVVSTYVTGSFAPTSATQGVTIDITPSLGPTDVSLYNPTGVLIATASIPAGFTGGVGYWNPLAPTGIYTFGITGPNPTQSGLNCGGTQVDSNTVTDAIWSGVISW
jgi:hypothetical protein